MIKDQRKAKSFAGKMTAAMIRMGASGSVMRENKIPASNYYGTWGGRKWETMTPKEAAADMMTKYKPSVLFLENSQDHPRP